MNNRVVYGLALVVSVSVLAWQYQKTTSANLDHTGSDMTISAETPIADLNRSNPRDTDPAAITQSISTIDAMAEVTANPVDTEVHIGEFIDVDDLSDSEPQTPIHIGEPLDVDDLENLVIDTEPVHIGENLSAYDPTAYVGSTETDPLHIGDDLSYTDIESSQALMEPAKPIHVGDPLDVPEG